MKAISTRSNTKRDKKFSILKNTFKRLEKEGTKEVDESETTNFELLIGGSRVFQVSSKYSKDDDNILDSKKIKPLQF